jgi:hypothetical protein
MRRQRTSIVRARIMSPNACDYGAVGAALFEIVNVHFGRSAELGALRRSPPVRERRRVPFWQFVTLA